MIDKIDIINGVIWCYDSDGVLINQIEVDSSCDEFLSTFSTTEDLLTVNITNPVKRIVKFYNIKDAIPSSYDELGYGDMTSGEKVIFDAFITLIESL